MNKAKYFVKQGCRIGFGGMIHEAGSVIELDDDEAKKISEYIIRARQTETKKLDNRKTNRSGK
jgi:hypothetical protein